MPSTICERASAAFRTSRTATVQGGDVREIIVEVDPNALAAAHLSADDVATDLGKSQRLQAIGRLDRGVLQYQVMADTLTASLPTLEQTIVGGTPDQPMRLLDVGRRCPSATKIGWWPEFRPARRRGGHRVSSTGRRRAVHSRDLEAVLETRAGRPRGIEIHPVYDQAELTRHVDRQRPRRHRDRRRYSAWLSCWCFSRVCGPR